MRTLAIGILALLASGCAAGRDFNLVPRDPEAPWQVGHHWVRTESNQATVNLAYDREWYGHLVFDVEVVNQSGATLHVDPAQFSYTIASTAADLPRKLREPIPALAPEVALARVDRQIRLQAGATAITSFVAVAVLAAAVVASAVVFADVESYSADECGSDSGSSPAATSTETAAVAEPTPPPVRSRVSRGLLRVTDLAPGASVRGEIWLPARPLQKAVGPEVMASDNGITGPTKQPTPADHGLTLRMPPELGGQEVDYSIAVD